MMSSHQQWLPRQFPLVVMRKRPPWVVMRKRPPFPPVFSQKSRQSSWGYRDSSRLLGESCRKKMRGHSGKKFARKSRNSCWVNGRGCGCIGIVDAEHKCAHSWNQIQTLKECHFCHIYYSQVSAHLCTTVTASRAVSNWESRYPHRHEEMGAFSLWRFPPVFSQKSHVFLYEPLLV